MDTLFAELAIAGPQARAHCKKLVSTAYSAPSADVDAVIRSTYREMMMPCPEAEYAIKEFREGRRSVNWESGYQNKP